MPTHSSLLWPTLSCDLPSSTPPPSPCSTCQVAPPAVNYVLSDCKLGVSDCMSIVWHVTSYIYIYHILTNNPCFPFSLFSFVPPLSSSFCSFLGVNWEVLACMTLTSWKLSTKLRGSIQNGYGSITFSSSWCPLSFVPKILKIRKETLVWRVCVVIPYTIVGIFPTKPQVTPSILRIWGSMTSH